MTDQIKLREVCHARAGDKGDTVNIGLVCHDPDVYPWLKQHLTTELVSEYLAEFVKGPVERYELPEIGALNFVVHNALGGGVTRSLRIDGHGKGFSAILLEMEIEGPVILARSEESRPVVREMVNDNTTIRLGGGSAYEADHLDAARDLAQHGALDYLIFDCLSEKTIAECAIRKQQGGVAYDVFLEPKLRAVLAECIKNGTKIIANAGGLDVEGAARLAAKICRELELPGVKIAYVLGGDVMDLVQATDPMVRETGQPVSSLGNNLVSAHAYSGAQQIVDGLERGAHIVLTSRAGDSAQYLAPMIHDFGWALDDWNRIGKGLGVGHLLECAGQITGGYFADLEMKDVANLHRLGFPIAEVYDNGDAVITKLPGTGGVVSERTCKEQLLYEIADPGNYVHADGVVDFTNTRIRGVGSDRVSVTGTTGHPRTPTAKIALGNREGYVGLGRIVYGGTGAYEKACLAAEIVAKRLSELHGADASALRFDFIGVNALFPWKIDPSILKEVELRVAGQFANQEDAQSVLYEVSMLPCNGPAGASWGRPLDQGGVEEVIGFHSTLLPHDLIEYEVCEIIA